MGAKSLRGTSGPTAWSALLVTVVLLASCGGTSTTSPLTATPSASGPTAASARPDVGLATTEPTSSPTPSAAAPTGLVSSPGVPSADPTPTAVPAPGSPPPPLTGTYVVGAGDTLWGIGQRYGLSVEQLLAANPQLIDRSVIRTGGRLTIPLHELPIANATLDLPSLPLAPADAPMQLPGCAQGKVTFSGGYALPSGGGDWWSGTSIADVARMDVDQDGKADVVVLITCLVGEASFDRVVAFRERADGTFATIGLVVQTDWVAGDFDPDQIQGVNSIDATPGGDVVATVWGIMCSCSPTVSLSIDQQRTYNWHDGAFVQTAGSTTFVVPPGTADLTVERSIAYGTPVDGVQAGTLKVTVRNGGASAVEDVSILLWNQDIGLYTRAIERLDPGASATVTFRDPVSCHSGEECVDPFALQVRIGAQVYCDTQGVRSC